MSILVADEAVDTSDVNSVLTILLLLAETCPTQASQVIGHGDQHLPVLVYNNKVNVICSVKIYLHLHLYVSAHYQLWMILEYKTSYI